jgi:glycosyltransferase involved in cell wall biosynthesis
MRRLLVFSYFCPGAVHRPGGVQQVVGPLLDGLTDTGRWQVTVAHPDPCHVTPEHELVDNPDEILETDDVEPDRLETLSRDLRILAAGAHVVLSIDRVIPTDLPVPRVLMSNSVAYRTEASPIVAGGWSAIVVPTRHFAGRIRAIRPQANIATVPYGLPRSAIEQITGLPPPRWDDASLVVQLPHRPDRRKGHVAGIEGLSHQPPSGRSIHLDIAWLHEPRYAAYRQELQHLAEKLDVANRVTFRPWLNGHDRWHALATAHATLQVGTFEETFGIAAVEAALAGRLVITTHQPAVHEILTSPLLHVEVDDPLRWCHALEVAAVHATTIDLHDHTTRLASRLNLDRMIDHYDIVLEQTAEARWE